jgi:hypothetical protein
MYVPQPTEQHRRLRRLAGRWQGTETVFPSSWAPDGTTPGCMMDARLGGVRHALVRCLWRVGRPRALGRYAAVLRLPNHRLSYDLAAEQEFVCRVEIRQGTGLAPSQEGTYRPVP